MNYTGLPESLRDGMRLYIEHGVPPGSFLEAVLSNDLCQSFARADMTNRWRLGEIMLWIFDNAPPDSWGSPKNYHTWRKAKLQEQNEKAVKA